MELMKKLNTGELWETSSDELSTFASGGIPLHALGLRRLASL
jgi:hypothetical protein